jgi:microcystin-dependent protein
MPFDWSEYESDSDTEEVSLLLSVKSQSLILAAMQSLQFRSNWLEIDDTTYDDIDAAVAEAYEEIMRPVMPDFTPVGAVNWFPLMSYSIPAKWLICDGATLERDDYPDLYDAFIGTPYRISGTQLQLPDLGTRFIYGSEIDNNVGDTGGNNSHTLTIDEMPAHTHIQRGRNSGGANLQSQVALNADAVQTTTITTTGSTGGGGAHNNMPAYLRGYFAIKALP